MAIEVLGVTPEEWARFRADFSLGARALFGVTLDPWQDDLLRAVSGPDKRIAVRACHGPGKTAVLSWSIWLFLATRPDARVPCTAPTEHQLLDILWPELTKWYERSQLLQDLFEMKRLRIEMRAAPNRWFAFARVAKIIKSPDGISEVPGLQGAHEDHLLFVIDEASGVDDAVFGVVEGALATGDAKALVAGNPNLPYGQFYRCFTKDREYWRCFHVSYKDSSRVSNEWAESMIERYGIEHPWVRVKVLGEFPLAASDAVFSLQDFQNAYSGEPRVLVPRTLGVDVARYGNARSVIAVARGTHVRRLDKYYKLDTHELASHIVMTALAENVDEVVIDADGIGAGVYDIVKRNPDLLDAGIRVTPWRGSAAPLNTKMFYNARTELVFKLRDAMRAGDVRLPEDDDLEMQGVSLKYKFLNDGRIQLERKEDLMKRIGMSTDELDAVAYALAPVLKRRNTEVMRGTRTVGDLFATGRKMHGLQHLLL